MSKLTHDLIKMNLAREGYLPNYPYHLLSDKEMIDAFIKIDSGGTLSGYFADFYPDSYLEGEMSDEYRTLVDGICYHLGQYLMNKEYIIPDWVYSYMLGSCIGPQSDTLDKHDLFVLLNLDNIDDEFDLPIHKSCYDISKEWVHKLSPSVQEHRPPTLFGEPHVIKSLRLAQVDVLK